MGHRKINVKTGDIINALKANKIKHLDEFEKAKIAYKKEGLEQAAEIIHKLEAGDTNLKLELIEPVNKSHWYDEKITMFKYEVNEIIELDQLEFEAYVLDLSHEMSIAKFNNTVYSSKY